MVQSPSLESHTGPEGSQPDTQTHTALQSNWYHTQSGIVLKLKKKKCYANSGSVLRTTTHFLGSQF